MYSSFAEKQVPGIILGALFLVLGLFTDGVCCMGSCSAPVSANKTKDLEDTIYEEVDTRK